MTDIVERLRERKANWMEAIAVMEAAADEIERLRNLFKSLHWHLVESTVNKSVFLDIVEQALKTKGRP